ncbi:MAG: IS3 family transposase [Myxococcales bacterium]|nr:IS3 family transposase [Myxococcales bacterium]
MVGTRRAAAAIGTSRASLFRKKRPAVPKTTAERPVHPKRLTSGERSAIVDVLHSERFADSAPRAIVATLLEEGRYLCAPRTMYRILAEHGELRERRNQRRHPKRAAPTVTATQPNEAWVWDVTKVRGPTKGSFFYLAVIMDLFSRYILAWACENSESAHVATTLFGEATRHYGITPGQLVVHADRGSAMKSKALAELFEQLGIRKSHSRPRCSNDNPHMESAFKTYKYAPAYPGRFADIGEAKDYARAAFPMYNTHHRHSSLAFLTPETVFTGKANDIIARKQATLDRAYESNPGRFPKGRPIAPALPARVVINPDRGVEAIQEAH